MNKYKLKDFLYEDLNEFRATLKQTSYDKSNDQYLCQDTSTSDVYDFDEYVRSRYSGDKLPASPDAIHIGHKKLYFVEFKNQVVKDIDKKQLQKKFASGTDLLNSMLDNYRPRDRKYFFCVVHKPPHKPRHFDYRPIQQSLERFDLVKLNREHGNFYDRIIMREVAFFIQEFSDLKCD